jgi:hypothetical protein
VSGMPDCRMRGFVVGGRPPFGEGSAVVSLDWHPYLLCDPCGARLGMGQTAVGATVFVCVECAVMADVRRVA